MAISNINILKTVTVIENNTMQTEIEYILEATWGGGGMNSTIPPIFKFSFKKKK